MSAPLAKGIIIAASVIVAAGIAIYENEQIRLWLDEHRRRIAIAFYALGDGINPSEMEMRTPAQQAELAERNRERRLEIVRQNKRELLQRAREQGIAVDLDQLVALNMQEEDAAAQEPQRTAASGHNSATSFDDMIGEDGKLKPHTSAPEMLERPSASTSSFRPLSDDGLRQRGGAGSRGFASGSSFASTANPFDDDAHVLLDQDMSTNAPTIRSISPRPESHILDEPMPYISIPVTESEPVEMDTQSQFKTEDELEAEVQEAIKRSLQEAELEEAIRRSLADGPPLIDIYSSSTTETTLQYEPTVQSPSSVADSLYDPPSPPTGISPHSLEESLYGPPSPRLAPQSMTNSSIISLSAHSAGDELVPIEAEEEGERTPSGMMTPTDDGFSTISSAVGHSAPDIAVLADLEPLAVPTIENMDARSEAAETNDSFSVIGASTPGSWTDVDSESETEAGNGQSHIIQGR